MGIGPFGGDDSCPVYCSPSNPNPNNWELLELKTYEKTYVAKIKYHGCTNFEGVKILVFEGEYKELPNTLDPHFSKESNIVARFIPTDNGWHAANVFAKILSDASVKCQ